MDFLNLNRAFSNPLPRATQSAQHPQHALCKKLGLRREPGTHLPEAGKGATLIGFGRGRGQAATGAQGRQRRDGPEGLRPAAEAVGASPVSQ